MEKHQIENEFNLEINKKTFLLRIQKDLLILISILLVFSLISMLFDDQRSFVEHLSSLSTLYILYMIIFFPIILLKWKKHYFRIQISNSEVLLSGLNFDKLFSVNIAFRDLDVKVVEAVNRFGKLQFYYVIFSNGKKNYRLNADGEWTPSDISKILIELDNKRKNHSFLIDGFHFLNEIKQL